MNKLFNDPALANNLFFLIAICSLIYEINKERKKQGLPWHQIGKLSGKLNIGKILLTIVVISLIIFIITSVSISKIMKQ